MKIIVAHNFYQQPGGEDQVFHGEIALLREFGHAVTPFEVHNDAVAGMGKLKLMAATVWNRDIAAELRSLLQKEKPDIVHFHNTFPLMSPAVYKTAANEGAAVVQTLHNFRLLCPSALLYRDGHACEDCLGKTFAYPAVRHACYRKSRLTTAVTASAVAVHRLAGTWNHRVDGYIALTPFAKDKFIAGGLPAGKLHIKPNFVHPDPGQRAGGGGYAVFVGRLSHEKGLPVLLKAWETLGRELPLKIIGDGPLADDVKAAMANNSSITWLGRRTLPEIYDTVGDAELLVFPSQCYETFGRVAVEAFAVGTPVVASGHGAMADVIGNDGRLGTLFTPGDAQSLVQQVRGLRSTSALGGSMRDTVRAEFEQLYTGPRNHNRLMDIYTAALANRSGVTAGFENDSYKRAHSQNAEELATDGAPMRTDGKIPQLDSSSVSIGAPSVAEI